MLSFGLTSTPSYSPAPPVMLAGSAYHEEFFLVISRNSSGTERPLTVIVRVLSPAVRTISTFSSRVLLAVGVYSTVSVVVKPVTPAGTAVSPKVTAKLLLAQVAVKVVGSSKFFADTLMTRFTFCPCAVVIHPIFFALIPAPQVVV